MSDWQPIETAPKDGTAFLATGWDRGSSGGCRHTVVAYWDKECGFLEEGHPYDSNLTYLDYWMPLPSPPEDQK